MADDQIEQANAYRNYFEAVKDFNSVNNEYIRTASEIANNRKLAIQKAIEIHINSLQSRVRVFQLGSIVVGILSTIFFCIGIIMLSGSFSSSSQAVETVIQGRLGPLLTLGSLGPGVLALIIFAWTSSKLNSLDSNIREAQEKTINPFAE